MNHTSVKFYLIFDARRPELGTEPQRLAGVGQVLGAELDAALWVDVDARREGVLLATPPVVRRDGVLLHFLALGGEGDRLLHDALRLEVVFLGVAVAIHHHQLASVDVEPLTAPDVRVDEVPGGRGYGGEKEGEGKEGNMEVEGKNGRERGGERRR